MLNLQVSVHGDKVLLNGLGQFNATTPEAIGRGLTRAAKGIHRSAFEWLSGAGGMNTYETRTGKSGKTYQKKTGTKVEMYEGFTRASGDAQMFRRYTDSGGYPVPVRTGNLRRLLDWVKPGESKNSGGHTFAAGPMEVIVYDSAEYASVIHEGRGSSAKFGRRPFLDDALKQFNDGAGVAKAVDEEIQKEADKRGL